MMRRGLWLAAGAALGVVGYRRLDRATKSLSVQLTAAPVGRHAARSAGWLTRQLWQSWSARGDSRGRVQAFVGHLRPGSAEYLDRHEANFDRHQSQSGHTLIGQRTHGSAHLA